VIDWWCEQAWLGGDTAVDAVLIRTDGGVIRAVETGATEPVGARRLAGVTFPGFANGHSHAFHLMLRGQTHAGAGSFWTWREQMYRAATVLDPDGYHELAVAVYREMLAAGYTVVGEFHYLHHDPSGVAYADPNAMGQALLEAARVAGIRITLLDTLYLHGGLDGGYLPLDPVQRRFSDGSAESWAERVMELAPGTGARVGAAIHSVRAVDPRSAGIVADLAAANRMPLHAHVSEQPAENAACIDVYGATPTQLLDGVGALGDRFTAVHATHLTGGDIDLLAGGFVCLCPTTERDLADGIGPSIELAAAEVGLTIGSDSQTVIDPFEEMRAVEYHQRLDTLRRGNHSVGDLLAAGTSGGYRSLGWPEGGRLAPGALADFVTVGFDSPRLAGIPNEHRAAAVVFSASPADITSVVVAGQTVS
jgi:formiminoglutamate deiminase